MSDTVRESFKERFVLSVLLNAYHEKATIEQAKRLLSDIRDLDKIGTRDEKGRFIKT